MDKRNLTEKVGGYIGRCSAALFMLCAGVLVTEAIPARKGVIEVRQPDGSVIEACLHGDEYTHYMTTPDGKPLELDNRGFYREATVDADIFFKSMEDRHSRSMRRRADGKRLRPALKAPGADGKGYGLFPGTSFPSTGSPDALVLLVEYSDVKFTLSNPHDYFSRMVNEEGFSDYGGTGSALDFFKENSGGQFTPIFDVVGPVTLSGTQEYYGANGGNGDDLRAHMMAVEGCRMLDSQIDFSKYDNDGDGVIDNVFVFFAGEAESSTGVSKQVWPHTGFVSYMSSVPVMLDGVKLDRYACSNEWQMPYRPAAGETGRPDGVGTFVHEFSHVMGLPDLYSVKYNNAFTPGAWSALDYGPYNNDGCTPPNYSVFERYALGWMQPREITSAANVRLEPIASNQGAVIPTAKDTEFFLFENRQQTGWDKYIPGHGMLVWHIDYNADVWEYNMVNTTVAHQYVDLEEADGMASEETRKDDAFPSSLGRTEFNDKTIPSMMPWTGRSVNLPVSAITERPDGVVTFKVAGGRPDVSIPVASEATEITPGGFKASWTASSEPDCTYTLSVYTRTGAGAGGIVYAPGYNHLNVGAVTEYTVTGLSTDTQYYYAVSTVVAEGESEPSNEIAVRTDPPTFDYLAPEALKPESVSDHGFTARWEALAGAADYTFYLTTPEASGHLIAECGFDGGIAGLPGGWSTDANSTYAIAANCGKAAPSLRFTREGQVLETGVYADGIYEFSFWMRGISTNQGDAVKVELRDMQGEWHEHSTHPVSSATGGATIVLESIPEGTTAARITAGHTKGSVAVDDVTVGHGTAYKQAPVAPYHGMKVSGTSIEVKDVVKAQTEYRYYVVASDGKLSSLPSNEIVVLTPEATGIDRAEVSGVSVRIDGRTAYVSGVAGTVKAYGIDGRLVGETISNGSEAAVTLPGHGVYVLRCGENKSVKIIIK